MLKRLKHLTKEALGPLLSLSESDEGAKLAPISYRLVRTKRKSIGFRIDESGLTVRAPHWVSQKNIEQAIEKKRDWIETNLAKFAALARPEVVFEDGARLPYRGQTLTLCFEQTARRAYLRGEAHQLALVLDTKLLGSPERCQNAIKAWYRQSAQALLETKLEGIAVRSGVGYTRWALSNAKTRWGSCSSQGVIRLNWRLIFLDDALVDYVVAHELAHRKQMNHSERFWFEVAQIYPQYSQARKALKAISMSQLPF